MRVSETQGWLEGIRTRIDSRGKGIASLLISRLEDIARRKSLVKLGFATGRNNVPMHAIAKIMGFNPVYRQFVFEITENDLQDLKPIEKNQFVPEREDFDFICHDPSYNNSIPLSFLSLPFTATALKECLRDNIFRQISDGILVEEVNHQENTETTKFFSFLSPKNTETLTLISLLEFFAFVAKTRNVREIILSAHESLAPGFLGNPLWASFGRHELVFFEKAITS